MRVTPRAIDKQKLLLVEGRDALIVIGQLVIDLAIDIQVMDFGGVTDLSEFIQSLVLVPGFVNLTTIALVRDADGSATSARQSVQHHLNQIGSSGRRTSAFILPNDVDVGMLETLCLSTVADDATMSCVKSFAACLEKQGIVLNEKGLVQAFLSTREKPGLKIGEAYRARFWPLNRAPLNALENFLRSL
jgi:hypothetical protein